MYVHFADGSYGPANIPSPIDQAWQTRVPHARHDVQEAWRAQRELASANYWAQQKRKLEGEAVRPFRFEDLKGEPEPEKWGPVYPKTASAAVEKWRMVSRGRELDSDEKRAYGAAVHAWLHALNNPRMRRAAVPESDLHYKFSAAKHCAALRARFHAGAAADKRAWALGQSKDANGDTIKQAYARAMAEKRNRESASAAAEAVRVAGLEAVAAALRPMLEAA